MAPRATTLRFDRDLTENAILLRRHLLELGEIEDDLMLDLTALREMGAAALGVIAGYARSHRRRGWQCTYVVGDPRLFRLLTLSETPVILRGRDARP